MLLGKFFRATSTIRGFYYRLYENDFGKGQREEIILFRISPTDNVAKIFFVKPTQKFRYITENTSCFNS